MLLGRVIGTLTPCVVYQGLEGVPMLWVQPLDKQGNSKGEPLVALGVEGRARRVVFGELLRRNLRRAAGLRHLQAHRAVVDNAEVTGKPGGVIGPHLEGVNGQRKRLEGGLGLDEN